MKNIAKYNFFILCFYFGFCAENSVNYNATVEYGKYPSLEEIQEYLDACKGCSPAGFATRFEDTKPVPTNGTNTIVFVNVPMRDSWVLGRKILRDQIVSDLKLEGLRPAVTEEFLAFAKKYSKNKELQKHNITWCLGSYDSYFSQRLVPLIANWDWRKPIFNFDNMDDIKMWFLSEDNSILAVKIY